MAEHEPCPQVPHDFVQIYLYRCDHVGEHVLHLSKGQTDTESTPVSIIRFGPFDTTEDVLDYLRRYVLYVM